MQKYNLILCMLLFKMHKLKKKFQLKKSQIFVGMIFFIILHSNKLLLVFFKKSFALFLKLWRSLFEIPVKLQ